MSQHLRGSKSWAPLFLRLGLASIFIMHGAQKLFGWFGGKGIEGYVGFFESIGLIPGKVFVIAAGCGEFVGGILILFGFVARLGAFAIAVVMAVALAMVHIPKGEFFGDVGFEFPFILLMAAMTLVLSGPGKFSLHE